MIDCNGNTDTDLTSCIDTRKNTLETIGGAIGGIILGVTLFCIGKCLRNRRRRRSNPTLRSARHTRRTSTEETSNLVLPITTVSEKITHPKEEAPLAVSPRSDVNTLSPAHSPSDSSSLLPSSNQDKTLLTLRQSFESLRNPVSESISSFTLQSTGIESTATSNYSTAPSTASLIITTTSATKINTGALSPRSQKTTTNVSTHIQSVASYQLPSKTPTVIRTIPKSKAFQ